MIVKGSCKQYSKSISQDDWHRVKFKYQPDKNGVAALTCIPATESVEPILPRTKEKFVGTGINMLMYLSFVPLKMEVDDPYTFELHASL